MKRWIVATLCLGMVGIASTGALAQTGVKPQTSKKAANGKRLAIPGEVSHSAHDAKGQLRGRGGVDWEAHPATQDPTRLVTAAELSKWFPAMNNWGRWGPNDTKGALNLITPEKTLQAAKLVKSGVVVPLASWLGLGGNKYEVDTWRRVQGNIYSATRDWMGNPQPNTAVSFGTHDGTISHNDALCHYAGAKADPTRGGRGAEDQVTYNGYPFVMSDVSGCPKMGIDEMGSNYATRGVLYDMVMLKGGPNAEWNDPTLPIFPEDLEEWERFTGAKVGQGDVMVVNNGRYQLRAKEGAWYYDGGNSGLHVSVIPWVKERSIALMAGDGPNDVQPSGVPGLGRPVHQFMMAVLGTPIIDNTYTVEVAKTAKQLKRWEFMVSWRNLDIPGGAASPWNAVAIF